LPFAWIRITLSNPAKYFRRRPVERDLPHMSWFHRSQAKRLDAVDENAEAVDGHD